MNLPDDVLPVYLTKHLLVYSFLTVGGVSCPSLPTHPWASSGRIGVVLPFPAPDARVLVLVWGICVNAGICGGVFLVGRTANAGGMRRESIGCCSPLSSRTRQSLGQLPFAGGLVMTIVTTIKRNYCFRSPDDGVGSWFLQ